VRPTWALSTAPGQIQSGAFKKKSRPWLQNSRNPNRTGSAYPASALGVEQHTSRRTVLRRLNVQSWVVSCAVNFAWPSFNSRAVKLTGELRHALAVITEARPQLVAPSSAILRFRHERNLALTERGFELDVAERAAGVLLSQTSPHSPRRSLRPLLLAVLVSL